MSGAPADIYNGFADIFVKLENDPRDYWFEVATPSALVSDMKENNKPFVEPLFPFIIVRELTGVVIKEAIEAFIAEEKDDYFWFKFYYAMPYLTVDDLNLIIDRHDKEVEAKEKEDWLK